MENDDDRSKLQGDINSLLDWVDKWQMQFNAAKCKVLHVGKKNPRFRYTMGGLAPAGRVLENTAEEKDIGVMVHESLKPSSQCAKATKKANQVLIKCRRVFTTWTKKTWISLYRRYCRPHLEVSIQA